MPAGVPACSPSGNAPLASSPGLQFAAVSVQSNQRAHVVAVASVGGQTRVVSTDIYQIVDDFGIFGVSNVGFNGNAGNGSIVEVDSQGNPLTNTVTNIDIGVGASGSLSCNGGVGSGVVVIPGPNFNNKNCPTPVGVLNVTPQDPQECTDSQSNLDAFSPCVAGSGFATDPNTGQTYCPLPGVTGLVGTVEALVPSSAPAGASTVYDCDTGGRPLVISSTGSSQPIPEGSYYITANSVQIGDIDPHAFAAPGLAGPVSLYILPASCYSGGDPINGAASYASGSCPAGSAVGNNVSSSYANCAASAPAPTQSLSFVDAGGSGSHVNVSLDGSVGGNPQNFNLYWAGCGPVPIGTGNNTSDFYGNIYAPGAAITANSHFKVVGSIVVGSLTSNGTPTIIYEYAEHQARVLQGWTELNYQISP
jgi:hypothetical protein